MTRFYLTAAAAPVSVTPDAGWEQTAGRVTGALSRSPSGTNTAIAIAEISVAASFDVLLGQWVSEPMIAGGTLSDPIELTVARSESSASADDSTRYVVRVVSGNGVTVRGSTAFVNAAEWSTTLTAVLLTGGTIDPVVCQAGDRLVIEYGYRAANTVATSFSGTIRYGGTENTDLFSGDTGIDATSRPAFIDLAGATHEKLFGLGTSIMTGRLTGGRLLVEAAFGADFTASASTWTWRDITADVRAKAKVSIKIGRGDEASVTQPATCAFTLDNGLGTYSSGLASGRWYPYVRRGTPIRVRVDADGTGYRTRFFGFADGWTPAWTDESGRDATVGVKASGTLRRQLQGARPVLSAIRRVIEDPLLTPGLQAYWPCEDPEGSRTIASALDGGTAMTISGDAEQPFPKFAGDAASFPCSAPLPQVNLTTWRGQVPQGGFSNQWEVRWLMKAPEDPLAGVSARLISVYTTGTLIRWDVEYEPGSTGNARLRGYNAAGTAVVNSLIGLNIDHTTRQYQLYVFDSGSSIVYVFQTIGEGYLAAGFVTSTVASSVSGAVITVVVAPDANVGDEVTIGHVFVTSDVTALPVSLSGLNANVEETASARIVRLCAENGLPITVTGSSTIKMGLQTTGTLIALLRECETADQGILCDGLNDGFTYVCRDQRETQVAAITLNAATGDTAREVAPVDDDQRFTNRATAKRTRGAEYTVEDVDGPLGTTLIGTYDDSVTVNINSDADIADYAGWLVGLGTRSGFRYPQLMLDLMATPSLAPAWAATTLSDRIDVTGISTVRTQHPSGTVSLLLEGYTEVIDQFGWLVTMNLSPYGPWRVGVLAATSGDTGVDILRAVSDGATLATSVAGGATSLSVVTGSGPLWTTVADDLPLSIEVSGLTLSVSAISGTSSPQTFTVSGVTKTLPAGSVVELSAPTVPGI